MRREKNHNNILGRRGESVAAALLCEKGLVTLERNWRSGHLEVDVICTDGKDLRFVEVKTRKEPVEGSPWEAVNAEKMRRLTSAANAFLHTEKCRNLPFVVDECHFDIVSIVFAQKGDGCTVEYIPDAFVPGAL